MMDGSFLETLKDLMSPQAGWRREAALAAADYIKHRAGEMTVLA